MSKELIKPFLKGKIEAFCQLIAAGGKAQADCYLESHPGTVIRRSNAGATARTLLRRPEVAARIHEIRAPAVAAVRKKIKYDLEDAFEELEKAYSLALAQMDPKAMKAVTELKAKLAGLVIARSEKVEKPLDGATTEELLGLRDELRRKKAVEEAGEGVPLLRAVK